MPSKRPTAKSATTTTKRNRPLSTFTLSPAAKAMVVELAAENGMSQSALLEMLASAEQV